MFTKEEWQFLSSNKSFISDVRDSGNSLDEVERLAIAGELLLLGASQEQESRARATSCDRESDDPGKHLGPFESSSVQELESGYVSNERCLSCSNTVRRVIIKRQTPTSVLRQEPT
jgi:hypothetical protein